MQEELWKNLPGGFLELLKEITPEDKLQSVLESYCVAKPVTFRANTLKITMNELVAELDRQHIKASQIPWYTDAFILDPSQTKEILTESTLHKEGKLYIQNLSSMIPPLVLDPKPGEIISDLTAAPGSKTTQMAMRMENQGAIVANDTSKPRLFKLQANLKEQGVTNTRTMSFPGQAMWKRYHEHFDATLVDVPCTMEGRFSALDPVSYEDWKPKKAKQLSQLQKYLLRSAIAITKPGGVIVYSTCTLEPIENEEVVDWVLEKEAGNVTLESIDLEISEFTEGLTHWRKRTFSDELKKTRRILPSKNMEGFYVAKLRKN